MPQNKQGDYTFWKELSSLILNQQFQYIDSPVYNQRISDLANETFDLLNRDDITISLYDYFLRNKEDIKAFIYIVIEDILFDKEFVFDSPLISPNNKQIIEEALNTISIQLTYNDLEFPTYNDYSHIINNYKSNSVHGYYDINQKKISKNFATHINEKFALHSVHNTVYNALVFRGLDVWKDYKTFNLYYRVKAFEDSKKTSKSELSNYLSKLLNINIDIYDSTDDIKYPEGNYLLVSLLPIVKMEVFDPSLDIEFPHIINNMFYKNTFQYTNYLKKRNLRPFPFVDSSSIIVDFIKELSSNDLQFNYTMNWLASFYQNLNSSKMALVLIGDNEITDILIYNIIKPIFAYRDKYFTTIEDENLKKLNDLIIKDKIFYHFKDINPSKMTDKKVTKILLKILSSKYTSALDAWENNDSFLNGELIVTANKNSPYSLLKDCYSRCSVFKVNHLGTVLNRLNIDQATLIRNIVDDLDNFSNILLAYLVNRDYCVVMDTDEKQALSTMKNGILRTQELEQKINNFIMQVKTTSIESFQNIKYADNDLYEELKYNFEQNMIAQPLLSTYFNLINNEIIFSENNHFLEILKEKTEMFKKAPNDKTKFNGKKRYKIF